MDNAVYVDTEIRKLKPAHRYTLAQILNVSDSWKTLMSMILKEDTNTPRFTNEHISTIQQAACQHRQNAAEIFLDEWGTMGRKRPTIRTLLDLSIKAELFRAADYIAGDILKVDLPKRPDHGPAAAIDISDESLATILNEQIVLFGDKFKDSSVIGSTFQDNTEKIKYFPDAADLMNHCSMRDDMHTNNKKVNKEKCSNQADESNLIKFSTNGIENSTDTTKKVSSNGQNKLENNLMTNKSTHVTKNIVQSYDFYKNQEIATQELPTFLNDFKAANAELKNEIKSEELPVFLNEYASDTLDNFINTSSVISHSSNAHAANKNPSVCNFQGEANSCLLPQCLLNDTSNSKETAIQNSSAMLNYVSNNKQNVLTSQDLPVTVLEYNKGTTLS